MSNSKAPSPALPVELEGLDGAWLILKPKDITSFGLLETLQRDWKIFGLRKKDLPSLGHGGTLDPFATGLLVAAVGRGVKLTRYFLGSSKTYTGLLRFGETTVPGDPTEAISESSAELPASLETARTAAKAFTDGDYLQVPPMHSAKKIDGQVLHELARQGVEIERKPACLTIHRFELEGWESVPRLATGPHRGRTVRTRFEVNCSSGTYIRVLAQDLGKRLGTVAMLDSLHRKASGTFTEDDAIELEVLRRWMSAHAGIPWTASPGFIPFDRMLDGVFPEVLATDEEARSIIQGQQQGLDLLTTRASGPAAKAMKDEAERVTVFAGGSSRRLLAVLTRPHSGQAGHVQGSGSHRWTIERVFPEATASEKSGLKPL